MVQLRILTKPCSPSQLIDYTAQVVVEERHGTFRQVWCVFDVDEFPDVADACRAAKRRGFHVAVSNPCFELWLLLHFQEQRAHLPAYKDVERLLRKHIPAYDKAQLTYATFAPGVDAAGERARGIDETGEAVHLNPSTGVWRLVEDIKQAGKP